MTDYRLRNHELLYAPRGKRPLDGRVVVIFALIAAVVVFGVAGHLAERFNAATPGSTVTRQALRTAPVHVAAPETSGSGS
jgi:hypothetical protein